MSITARSDKKKIHSGRSATIYLDYAAATPTDPRVLAAMIPYFDARYGNPSSLYASGRRAAQAIQSTRKDIAKILGALPEEIIFTGSGTESDNLAVIGAARANRAHGNHIIISALEHKATIEAARQLEKEGFEISLLPVDRSGIVDPEELIKTLRAETILVSIMYANNEIGTIQPIKKIATIIREKRGNDRFPLLHTDASQATGFFSLDVNGLGVDLMTLNSSKIYGPKGVGLLYKRRDVALSPIIMGGGQENRLRAGTESLPLIVGLGVALKEADRIRKKESMRLTKLRDYFIGQLRKKIPNLLLNGHASNRLPNNVSISIPRIEGESMLLMLDELGIEVSTGSACSALDLKPSHVLLAMGQPDELAHGSIRFSFGRGTTKAQLDHVLKVFPPIVEWLTKLSALK